MYELAVAGSDYDALVCAESRVFDRRHLSELRNPGFVCSQQRLKNSTTGGQGMALYVTEGFRSFRPSKLECYCHESIIVSRICSRINNLYVNAIYSNPGHNGSFMSVSKT